jgi:N-acetylglucosamine-6-phosphate deacetylase
LDDAGFLIEISPYSGSPDYFCLSPGFVDIQMNGYGLFNVAESSTEELQSLGATLAELGTTSWLGTIVTASLTTLTQTVSRLQHVLEAGSVSGFVGIHIEGPFLGNSPGAHRVQHIVATDIDWIRSLPSGVRLVTLAPEQSRASLGISALVENGVIVSLGHSQPSDSEYDTAVEAGATLVTHVFNAMSGVHHRAGGLALRALVDDRMSVSLIADLVHVRPEIVSLVFRAKGDRNVCLVSDSVAWESPTAVRNGMTVSDAVRLADGTLAGSASTLADCVKNIVHHCGVSLERALRAATSTPAELLQMGEIGTIAPGRANDIIALDSSLTVVNTWLRLPSVGA